MKDQNVPPIDCPIIIVEDLAHVPSGHYSFRFAELGEGFSKIGCNVSLLTAVGWHHTEASPGPAAEIYSYGGLSRIFFNASEFAPRLAHRFDLCELFFFARIIRKIGSLLKVLALVSACERLKKIQGNQKCIFVVVSMSISPTIVSILSGNDFWIIHRFHGPPAEARTLITRMADLREKHRRTRGGAICIAVPSREWKSSYDSLYQEIETHVIPLAGVRASPTITISRESLGLPKSGNLALVYGSIHPEKRPQTIVNAARLASDWTFVFGAAMAHQIVDSLADQRSEQFILMPGATSHGDRAQLYQVSNVVILSFCDGYHRNSGTLMDAISAGRPVIVSDGCFAAEIVKKFGIGLVFKAEDPADLARALDQVVDCIPAERMTAAQSQLGNDIVARCHLDIFSETRSAA
jgi:glycosyltransferase involved in cell wall biosynthesis